MKIIYQYLQMAGPGIICFGLFILFIFMYPSPPYPTSPDGFNGVFATGKNTGFIEGWKL